MSITPIWAEWKDLQPGLQFLKQLHVKLLTRNKNIKLTIIDQGFAIGDQLKDEEILVTVNKIQNGVYHKYQVKQLPDSCWGGLYSTELEFDPGLEPTHAFNCFINRMDATRQSWLYQLVRRNIFTEGLVSFNMDVSRHHSLGQYSKTTMPIEIFNDQFEKHCKVFQLEHDYIKSKVPFKNFDDSNLNNAVMKTKFSIVLETYFHDNRYVTYSEKIFRCLKLPRPWILFAMKGAVAHLRDMGFDVLDDIVDHGYDNIDFAIERQSVLLDLAQQLGKIEYTPALYTRLQQAAEFNQNLLVRFNKSFKSDCTTFFENLC
jgi:hypothetical protein